MPKVKFGLTAEETQVQIFQAHELIDRVQIIATMIDALCVNHPACENKDEWITKLNKASEILGTVYKKVSAHQDALIDHSNNMPFGADSI